MGKVAWRTRHSHPISQAVGVQQGNLSPGPVLAAGVSQVPCEAISPLLAVAGTLLPGAVLRLEGQTQFREGLGNRGARTGTCH